MNFSDLIIGAVIGVIGYKLGEKIQEIRQERNDSEYGLNDFVGEVFEDFQNGEGFSKIDKKFKDCVND